MEVTADRVEALITHLLQEMQLKLCGIKVSGRLSKPMIQVFIDWEDSPITIGECAKVSRQIQDVFDLDERFSPDYRLEVSSPGLDLPLTELWQFRRNIGRTIKTVIDGREFEAAILDVTSDGLVKLDESGGIFEIPVSQLSGSQIVLFPKKKVLAKRKRNEA